MKIECSRISFLSLVINKSFIIVCIVFVQIIIGAPFGRFSTAYFDIVAHIFHLQQTLTHGKYFA